MWLGTGQKVQSVQSQMGNVFMQTWSKSESPCDVAVFSFPKELQKKVENRIVLI